MLIVQEAIEQKDLSKVADLYAKAIGLEKQLFEEALVLAIDALATSHPQELVAILYPLFDHEPLSDALIAKSVGVLGKNGFLNYLESIAERNDLGPISIELLGFVASDHARFFIIDKILDRADQVLRAQLGTYVVRGVELLIKAQTEDDWDTIERIGDLFSHQSDLCQILRSPARLGLSDEALGQLFLVLDNEHLFGVADLFGFPDLYELAELYPRLHSEEHKKVVEKLFIGSVNSFFDKFEGISGDPSRAEALPYDDEGKLGALRSEHLSESMKKKCGNILRLLPMYAPYRDEKSLSKPAQGDTRPAKLKL